MPSRRSVFVFVLLAVFGGAVDAGAQAAPSPASAAEEHGPQTISAEAIQAAIDSLGNLDFQTRMNASRMLRRAPSASVAPALIRAVESHKDQFARFRASCC